MATVTVKLGDIGPRWIAACKQAVTDLNTLFKRAGVAVTLSTTGGSGPTILVKTDPGILGTAVHGRTSAATSSSGTLLSAEVRLPVSVVINTPAGLRDAGPGILEVIAAHEFIHALGQAAHNSHLMAQTMTKVAGNSAAGDKLHAGSTPLPPLQLAAGSIEQLKALWN
jgi:predicted Zn-dependent protease